MTRFLVTTRPDKRKSKNLTVFTEGSTLLTGVDDFTSTFGEAPTSLESDLLRIAAAIFATDRACARGDREEIGRQIELSVPVTNIGTLLPLVGRIEHILRFLSNDGWSIELRQESGRIERSRTWASPAGHTLLFSGGLDSLAAGIEFGGATANLQLVSHRTRNTVTSNVQKRLADALVAQQFAAAHRQFFVSSRSGLDLIHDEENSQRTRSFLFLVLGGIAARRTGQHRLVFLAENGQMAIHLPLDSSRIGAFSTHTAHPHALVAMTEFLSAALGVRLVIENPFLYRTKREVIQSILKSAPALLPISTSCWRNSRLRAGVTHCGSCVPCQIRRIAIEGHGNDPTAYERDLWRENIVSLPWDDDGRRNLTELIEFATQFRDLNHEDLVSMWPELISRDFNATEVIAMYKRFSVEAFGTWQRYPQIQVLM
jgi:7-cyano-7-deazaguanine synthase in queuosine biosynthesis